jgi:hypothetical protein
MGIQKCKCMFPWLSTTVINQIVSDTGVYDTENAAVVCALKVCCLLRYPMYDPRTRFHRTRIVISRREWKDYWRIIWDVTCDNEVQT